MPVVSARAAMSAGVGLISGAILPFTVVIAHKFCDEP